MLTRLRKFFAGLTGFFVGERMGELLEQVSYHEIIDGVMLLSDGRFEVGVEVDLLPHHYGPSSERYLHTLGTLLRLTPQNSRLRFVTQVLPEDAEVLANFERQTTDRGEAARRITQERRTYLETLRGRGEVTRWRSHVSLMEGSPGKARDALSRLETAEALERAQQYAALLLRQTELAGMKPRPLATDDTFELVFRYLNPSYANVKLGPYCVTEKDYPAKTVDRFEGLRSPTLRAQLLKGNVGNNRRLHLEMGGQYLTMIVLHTEPEQVLEKLGNLLTGSRVPFTAVVDFWHEDQAKAISKVKNRNRQAYADAVGGAQGLYSGPESSVALSEGERLITHLATTGDHVYRVMAAVVLTHDDLARLRSATDQLMSDLNGVPGMPFRKLEEGIFTPWLTFAPFSGQIHNEFASLVETHAKQFFPVNGPWRTELYTRKAVALYLTREHTLAAVDSFDPHNKNPHALFLGAPRSGKSFTAQHQLSATLRDAAVDAVIIDVGLNWKRTVENYHGVVVPVDGSGAHSINPFDLAPGQLRPSREDRAFLLKLLRVMVPNEAPEKKSDEEMILSSAITEAYAAALTEYPTRAGGWEWRLEAFTLSDFSRVLESLSAVGDRPVTADHRKVMGNLARRLRDLAEDSAIGGFIDRPTTLPAGNPKVVLFETSAFKHDERLMKVGTMLIQRAVWQRALQSKRTKTVLVVDEAWLPLQDDFASGYLEDILRRGAKEGLALWLITHSVNDLTGAKRAGIRQALTIFFIFRLEGEDDLLENVLGISRSSLREHKTITGLTGAFGEFYFEMRTEQEVRGEILVLRVSEAEYDVLTSHPEDLARLEEYGGQVMRGHAA